MFLFICIYLKKKQQTIIHDHEGENPTKDVIADYADPESSNYAEMVEEIRKRLKFDTLTFQRLDDLIETTGIEPCRLCTYCWNGKE